MSLVFVKSFIAFMLLLLASFVSFDLGELVHLTLLIGLVYALKTCSKIMHWILKSLFKILMQILRVIMMVLLKIFKRLTRRRRSLKVNPKIIVKIVHQSTATDLVVNNNSDSLPEIAPITSEIKVSNSSSTSTTNSSDSSSSNNSNHGSTPLVVANANVDAAPVKVSITLESILTARSNLQKTNLSEMVYLSEKALSSEVTSSSDTVSSSDNNSASSSISNTGSSRKLHSDVALTHVMVPVTLEGILTARKNLRPVSNTYKLSTRSPSENNNSNGSSSLLLTSPQTQVPLFVTEKFESTIRLGSCAAARKSAQLTIDNFFASGSKKH